MITKSTVETPPESPKQPEARPKSVTLIKRSSTWELETFVPPGEFFSDLDFNAIIRLLQHNRVFMRRQNALDYRKSQRESAGI